jgi:regulator of nucleoside diphosphate kinase
VETKLAITVTELDLQRLQRCLTAPVSELSDSFIDPLEEELARAEVIDAAVAAPGLVTMNSRVVFENVHNGRCREITLVYPQDADAAQDRISVLSPLGTALLGLSVGQEIDWPLPRGRGARFRVAKVVYQPEAAGDLHL